MQSCYKDEYSGTLPVVNVSMNGLMIHSFNVYLEYPCVDNETHLYYKTSNYDNLTKPYTGIGLCSNGIKTQHEGLMYGVLANSFSMETAFKEIGYYSGAMADVIWPLVRRYPCRLIFLWDKSDYILAQFCGVSTQRYLEFLRKYNYPDNLITWIENNPNYNDTVISHEIGFSIDKTSFEINRSAIYGVL